MSNTYNYNGISNQSAGLIEQQFADLLSDSAMLFAVCQQSGLLISEAELQGI